MHRLSFVGATTPYLLCDFGVHYNCLCVISSSCASLFPLCILVREIYFFCQGRGRGTDYPSPGTAGGSGGGHGGRGGRATRQPGTGSSYGSFIEPKEFGKDAMTDSSYMMCTRNNHQFIFILPTVTFNFRQHLQWHSNS